MPRPLAPPRPPALTGLLVVALAAAVALPALAGPAAAAPSPLASRPAAVAASAAVDPRAVTAPTAADPLTAADTATACRVAASAADDPFARSAPALASAGSVAGARAALTAAGVPAGAGRPAPERDARGATAVLAAACPDLARRLAAAKAEPPVWLMAAKGFAAAAAAMTTVVVVDAVCLSFFASTGTVVAAVAATRGCGAVADFMAGFVGTMVYLAFEGKLGKWQSYVQALVAGVTGAAGGYLLRSGFIQSWLAVNLNSLFRQAVSGTSSWLRDTAAAVSPHYQTLVAALRWVFEHAGAGLRAAFEAYWRSHGGAGARAAAPVRAAAASRPSRWIGVTLRHGWRDRTYVVTIGGTSRLAVRFADDRFTPSRAENDLLVGANGRCWDAGAGTIGQQIQAAPCNRARGAQRWEVNGNHLVNLLRRHCAGSYAGRYWVVACSARRGNLPTAFQLTVRGHVVTGP